MKKPKLSDYTFQETKTLFDEKVLMILRNHDKKHIVSLNETHRQEMIKNNYNPDNYEDVLSFLVTNNYF